MKVHVNMEGLQRFAGEVAKAIQSPGDHPHTNAALRQWGVRFRSFLMLRFDRLSKGGGWTPLKPETIARRRKGKRDRGDAILRDTSTLFAALTPALGAAPGQFEQDIPFGLEIGFGPARHPEGRATIADIAKFHQVGAGHLPVREVIVPPDEATIQAMTEDMQRAINRMAEEERE